MCGGVYEEDFRNHKSNTPGKDKADAKKAKQSQMEPRDGGVMGDLKFTTAGDYMDPYVDPGQDCQV